jgi:ABC-type transport system substrate-binding protein
MNPVTHHVVDGKVERRSIADAKRLMIEAGYPDGRDAATGKPLVLNYDYRADPSPETKSEINWMVRQFAKLGVQLEVRATTYNQYQDKVRKGVHQVFWNGWMADYPDAETFMALLYGRNSRTVTGGENEANYANPAFDTLYRRMATLDDGPEKQAVLDQMNKIAQEDAPWAFGVFPDSSGAYQPWLRNGKPSIMVRDMLSYYRVDAPQRVRLQAAWNKPAYPLLGLPLLAALGIAFVLRRSHRRAENATARPAGSALPC